MITVGCNLLFSWFIFYAETKRIDEFPAQKTLDMKKMESVSNAASNKIEKKKTKKKGKKNKIVPLNDEASKSGELSFHVLFLNQLLLNRMF